jgi:hypothetical protein
MELVMVGTERPMDHTTETILSLDLPLRARRPSETPSELVVA